jgi:hypothetical protein
VNKRFLHLVTDLLQLLLELKVILLAHEDDKRLFFKLFPNLLEDLAH